MQTLQKHSATELHTPGPFEELLESKLSQWCRRAGKEVIEKVSKKILPLTTGMD